MDIDVLANLKNAIEVQAATDKEQLNEILTDSKIIIVIVKGPEVLTKVVKVVPARKMAPRVTMPQQVLENIEAQRKNLNDNMDALYTFTLIEQTKKNIKKLNIKDMTPEAAAMFNREIRDLMTMFEHTIPDMVDREGRTLSESKKESM